MDESIIDLLTHIKTIFIDELKEEDFGKKSIERIEKCLDKAYKSVSGPFGSSGPTAKSLLGIDQVIKLEKNVNKDFPDTSPSRKYNCCPHAFLDILGFFCNNPIPAGNTYCEIHQTLFFPRKEICDSKFHNASLYHMPAACKSMINKDDGVDSSLCGLFCNNGVRVGNTFCDIHEERREKQIRDRILGRVEDTTARCAYSTGGVLCGKEIPEARLFFCEEHKKQLDKETVSAVSSDSEEDSSESDSSDPEYEEKKRRKEEKKRLTR